MLTVSIMFEFVVYTIILGGKNVIFWRVRDKQI